MILEIGKVVKVRNDLEVGECYWNEEKTDFEVFTKEMEITKGKEYMILSMEENGFILNWLGTVYTYDMLEH